MSLVKHALVFAVVVLCARSVIGQWQDPRQPSRDSLKGLKEIVVQVEYGFINGYPDDPSEQEIQRTVERFLKDAGIVVKQRPYGTSDNYPTLVVSVFFMNYDIYYHHMGVYLALRQAVQLPANPTMKLTSATWEWGGFGAGFSTYPKRGQINEVIAEFICDFRKANPDVKGWLPDCQSQSHIKQGTAKDRKSARLMTAADEELIRAAALNYVGEVKSLLAKGADPNAHDSGDTTVLSYAVRTSSRPVGDTAVAEMLLNRGANPNVSASCRLTPLMYAVGNGDLKMMLLLLERHADANAATPEGHTPLMAASMLGFPDAVSVLLKKGANVNSRTKDGQTALSLAVANMNLVPHYDRSRFERPYTQDTEGNLTKQAQEKHREVVRLLKAAGATPD